MPTIPPTPLQPQHSSTTPHTEHSAAGLTHSQLCVIPQGLSLFLPAQEEHCRPPTPHHVPPPPPTAAQHGCVSCMVYLLCHCPRAQRSSRNMQAAGSRPSLFSNDVEGEYTSRARRPTLPCATRTEPRESYFSGCPRWVAAVCPPIRPRSPPYGRSAAILTAAAGGVGPRGSTTGLGEKRNTCEGRRGPERGPSQPSQYTKVENKAESRSYTTDPRPGRALPPTPPSTLTCSRRRSPPEESEQRVERLFIEREGGGA